MDFGTEDDIRVRAYHLWEADGRPQGRDLEYWERAQRSYAPVAASERTMPQSARRAARKRSTETVTEKSPSQPAGPRRRRKS